MANTIEESKGVWCVAEFLRGKVQPSLYELITCGRKLADELGQPLSVVLIGDQVAGLAEGLGACGVARSYLIEHPAFAAFVDELHARALAELIAKEKPAAVLLPSSTAGRSLAARAAALAGAGLASEIVEASVADKATSALRLTRACSGGAYLVPVTCAKRRPVMATVRPGSYPKAESKNGHKAEVVRVPADPASWGARTKFIGFEPEASQTVDLAQADVIVSGGFGLGKAEGFKLVEDLAKVLGGAVGASRRAVDIGWIPYRHQVGLTGRTVKPKLYIAVGISGQVQHLAGMNRSDVIVSINNDPASPLMQMADFAVEGDLYEILPALIEEAKKAKGQ